MLAGNVFDDTGYSGENPADSAIDAKGNGWTIRDNTIRNPRGAAMDAIQTHTVHPGWGTDNVISGNRSGVVARVRRRPLSDGRQRRDV